MLPLCRHCYPAACRHLGLCWHGLEIVLQMGAGSLQPPLHSSELAVADGTLDPKLSPHRRLQAKQEQPSPKPPSHAGLVRPVPAAILGGAQASSAFLFKASFHQLFQALEGHISTPGGGGAQPSLPGCAATSLAVIPLPRPLSPLTTPHARH